MHLSLTSKNEYEIRKNNHYRTITFIIPTIFGILSKALSVASATPTPAPPSCSIHVTQCCINRTYDAPSTTLIYADIGSLITAECINTGEACRIYYGSLDPTLSPTISTLSPTISTLSPTTSTTSPTTSTTSPTISTLSPTTSTLSTTPPTASTLSPTASTLSPTASTLSPTTPSPTLNPSRSPSSLSCKQFIFWNKLTLLIPLIGELTIEPAPVGCTLSPTPATTFLLDNKIPLPKTTPPNNQDSITKESRPSIWYFPNILQTALELLRYKEPQMALKKN